MKNAEQLIAEANGTVCEFNTKVENQSKEIEKLLAHFVRTHMGTNGEIQRRLVLTWGYFLGKKHGIEVKSEYLPMDKYESVYVYEKEMQYLPYSIERHVVPYIKELILTNNLDRFLTYLVNTAIPAHMSGHNIPKANLF
jgi:hypothetical protein